MTPVEGYGAKTPVVNGGRRLRADAQRNRARVLEAAEEVFAAAGLSASTEEIARCAGVGIGTVFRHFPTKEALLEAVLVRRLAGLAEEARSLAGAADPGEALFGFLTRVIDQSASKSAFAEALSRAGVDVAGSVSGVGRELSAALDTLLRRAQTAGAVRTDVGTGELIALIVGASHAAGYASGNLRTGERAVAVILDGLRPRP